jgi:toxin CcdB
MPGHVLNCFSAQTAERTLGRKQNCPDHRLMQMSTRAVVPLLPLSEALKPAQTLNPVFDIAGEPHVMVTQYLAAVPDKWRESPGV